MVTPQKNLRPESIPIFALTALFLFLLSVYWFTMPKTVALEDDGLFIMAAVFDGVAHPPGYPLYMMVASAVVKLPFWKPVITLHALSGFFGALSCVGLLQFASRITNFRVGITAALLLGLSPTFWSQAIISEVYTLNVLLNLAMLIAAVSFARKPDALRFTLLSFVTGLSLSNHWPLTVLTGLGVTIIVFPHLRKILRFLPWGLIALGLALLPYLWMYLRSQHIPRISFLGPLESFGDFIYFVSRQVYADVDHSAFAGWQDKLDFTGFISKSIATQFTPLLLPWLMWGAIIQFRILPKTIAIGLITIALGHSVLLALLLGFEFSPLYQSVFRVYPLVTFALCAFWLSLGIHDCINKLKLSPQVSWTVGLGLPLMIGIKYFPDNNRHDYHWTDIYADAYLSTLPKEAILFVDGDIEAAVLGYKILIENQRPDILLMSSEGRIFDTRLFSPLHTPPDQRKEIIRTFIRETNRPVFYNGTFIEHPHGLKNYWLTWEIDKTRRRGELFLESIAPYLPYLDYILAQNIERDPWTQFHRSLLLRDSVPLLCAKAYGLARNAAYYQSYLSKVVENFSARLRWLQEVRARYPAQINQVRKQLKTRRFTGQAVTKREAQSMDSELAWWLNKDQ